MNVEIRTEAAQSPEKEYVNGSFLAVHPESPCTIPYMVKALKFSHSSNHGKIITYIGINYIAECDFALGCHFIVVVIFSDSKLCR
jgi:hypothetical protein